MERDEHQTSESKQPETAPKQKPKGHPVVMFILWSILISLVGFICLVVIAMLWDASLSPEDKAKMRERSHQRQLERAAEEKKNIENLLDKMVTDQTLYLPKNQMKLMPHLKDGARQLLQSGKCDFITDASISEKSTAKDPLFYYHCGKPGDANFGSFRLTVSQIKNKALNCQPTRIWQSLHCLRGVYTPAP
jgi:hypothetical protein